MDISGLYHYLSVSVDKMNKKFYIRPYYADGFWTFSSKMLEKNKHLKREYCRGQELSKEEYLYLKKQFHPVRNLNECDIERNDFWLKEVSTCVEKYIEFEIKNLQNQLSDLRWLSDREAFFASCPELYEMYNEKTQKYILATSICTDYLNKVINIDSFVEKMVEQNFVNYLCKLRMCVPDYLKEVIPFEEEEDE